MFFGSHQIDYFCPRETEILIVLARSSSDTPLKTLMLFCLGKSKGSQDILYTVYGIIAVL